MLDTPARWTQDILVGYGDLKPLGPVGDVGPMATWVGGQGLYICARTEIGEIDRTVEM